MLDSICEKNQVDITSTGSTVVSEEEKKIEKSETLPKANNTEEESRDDDYCDAEDIGYCDVDDMCALDDNKTFYEQLMGHVLTQFQVKKNRQPYDYELKALKEAVVKTIGYGQAHLPMSTFV
mmetsp:Transcript_42856/g.48694  ORF Transcript_42856/g.48694 Transcript_42856/m.48694 type:complete len:122 (+) Transcript_42856:86-451(+)|eukprot:CAMPEP_0194186404 /NCGR_PEP_ID=MMETSP0154-20130528/47002_1 /TAXON_ID=1049557 /ORGANISM="Thalassiothrix antarctica, Strain L6-D1" /LENGTH=121 /DNA_ID=CAMNT_0038905477 /DNA_START=66 /DNA_END=431 /DNA_ORIENTATION=+